MPIFLANLVDLYFTVLLGTPDALIGKLHFIYRFFFRDDFELLEVLGTALHFNTCGAHLVNNFSWKGPISLRTINFEVEDFEQGPHLGGTSTSLQVATL